MWRFSIGEWIQTYFHKIYAEREGAQAYVINWEHSNRVYHRNWERCENNKDPWENPYWIFLIFLAKLNFLCVQMSPNGFCGNWNLLVRRVRWLWILPRSCRSNRPWFSESLKKLTSRPYDTILSPWGPLDNFIFVIWKGKECTDPSVLHF